jgi:outer membrane protein OmpA-like peptidoglycan-associated protein
MAAGAVLLVGWFGFVRGDAQPERLRSRTEMQANRELDRAGFPWVRLHIDGNTARLQGLAPSEQARRAALDSVPPMLAPYMGMPGVFARVQTQFELSNAGAQPALQASRETPGLQARASVGAAVELPAASAGAARAFASPPALRMATVGAGLEPELDAAPVRPDASCQRELDGLQQAQVLHFRPASATLDVGQDEALDALAALFRRCPDGRVLVHGLRESPGGSDVVSPSSSSHDGALVISAASAAQVGSGLLLAQRRAQAVRAELGARGIALNRMQLGAGAREVAGDSPARVELTLAPAPRS